MGNFFKLNTANEDKIISREQRIYADTLIINEGDTFTVQTTSNAPRQKIKFFLDVLQNYEPDADKSLYFRIGEYYELEHMEQIQLFNSSGFYDIVYTCTENLNGVFDCELKITPVLDREITLYLSSLVFEDSFYNPESGWLNPDNPDNLIDVIEKEINPGLPAGAEPNDFLVTNDANEPEWMNGVEVSEYLPDATLDQRGLLAIDEDTIINDTGIYKVPVSSTTQLGVVKVDDTTIKIDPDGVISSSGGVDFSTEEQDTGLKWIDDKTVYQRTFVDYNSGILMSGVDRLISQFGSFKQIQTNYQFPIPYVDTDSVTLIMKLTNGDLVAQTTTGNTSHMVTVLYTKL